MLKEVLKLKSSKDGTIELVTFWGFLLCLIVICICSLNRGLIDILNNLVKENIIIGASIFPILLLICIMIVRIIRSVIKKIKGD